MQRGARPQRPQSAPLRRAEAGKEKSPWDGVSTPVRGNFVAPPYVSRLARSKD